MIFTKALSYEYWYNKDGSVDEILRLLVTCFNINAYYTLKNKYNNVIDSNFAFLDDPTVCISFRSDGKIDNIWGGIKNTKSMFVTTTHEKKGDAAITLIEQLLDNNELVLVQTVLQMVPFYIFYDPNFDIKLMQPGHVFMIVAHDEDNFYYVDTDDNLNIKNHIRYEHNRNIGVIKKRALLPAFDLYCKCFTIELDINLIMNYYKVMDYIIDECIKNYQKSYDCEDNLTVLYGYSAINKLIEACNNASLCLTDNTCIKISNLAALMNWKLRDLCNRRKILANCLKLRHKSDNNIQVDSLIETVVKCASAWELLRNVILKRYEKKNYIIDKSLEKYFINIRELEDNMNRELIKYNDSIITGVSPIN